MNRMRANDTSWMEFARLCDALAATRSKLKKRAAIAEFLCRLDARAAGLAAQYLTGAAFPETDGRNLQIGGQMAVRAVEAVTGASAERLGAVYRKHGDLGATAEELLAGLSAHPGKEHDPPTSLRTGSGTPGAMLGLLEIAVRMDALAAARTQAAKSAQLVDVLRALAPVEAKYFLKLLLGDMRMGVKQSLVEEAIAAAAEEELSVVRRAETMLGDIAEVVALAWRHELQAAQFRMFHPLGFMLATPAASSKDAYARFADNERDGSADSQEVDSHERDATAQIEDKYDGMRAQIHCGDSTQPGRVRIFSRTRDDVTESFPELAEWFAAVDTPVILDGEILAWDFEADRARPFTALQPRLGRKRVTAAMRVQAPVIYMAFDLLLDKDGLHLDLPLKERRSRLETWANEAWRCASAPNRNRISFPAQESLFVTDTVTTEKDPVGLRLAPVLPAISAAQIDAAFDDAQRRGNEGLMLKSLSSAYQPGRRGAAWIKLKRELATLDVVVTAVEYGHGKRAGVLSDYTFAVRDGVELRNVGKAYSGLTDAEIATLTQWFLEHPIAETNYGRLLVEAKIVLEVAFNNVMESDRHNSGYALRFPRIVRVRGDKPVDEIDTLERVREIFGWQARNRGES